MTGRARSAVVLGGSAAGSAAALLLARAGWSVTLVDPELDRLTDPGIQVSSRPGAPQAVHAHGFGSRAHVELSARLPDVYASLLDQGARVVPMAEMVPPDLIDGGRPADGDIAALQVRRPTLDRVLATAVAEAPVTRIVTKATGLLLELDGPVPAVRGLTLASGTPVAADVTIDAGGRRSPVTGWLRAAGLDQPERYDESVARYYTRHYAVVGEPPRLNSGFADIHGFTCHVQLLFLGDRGTAMLALAAHDEDPVLKLLRRSDAFEAIVAANDDFAAWRAVLEPTSDVHCLGAFDNRLRSLVREDRPLVVGLHQVGDALAMTNPTRGRGVAMALLTVGQLVDLLAEDSHPADTALAFEQWRRRTLVPYYLECAATDSIASAQLRAGLDGRSVPTNAPAVHLPDDHPITSFDLERAADRDPDLFRILLRASVMLDDERRVESPDIAEWVTRVLADTPPPDPERPPRTDGLHDRGHLERLLAAYA